MNVFGGVNANNALEGVEQTHFLLTTYFQLVISVQRSNQVSVIHVLNSGRKLCVLNLLQKQWTQHK